jgi:hypothetical protein
MTMDRLNAELTEEGNIIFLDSNDQLAYLVYRPTDFYLGRHEPAVIVLDCTDEDAIHWVDLDGTELDYDDLPDPDPEPEKWGWLLDAAMEAGFQLP